MMAGCLEGAQRFGCLMAQVGGVVPAGRGDLQGGRGEPPPAAKPTLKATCHVASHLKGVCETHVMLPGAGR